MAINLKALNENQLIELIRKAEQRKLEVAKEKLVKVRKKIQTLLEPEGLTLRDLFGHLDKPRRAVSTRYRDPVVSTRKQSGDSK